MWLLDDPPMSAKLPDCREDQLTEMNQAPVVGQTIDAQVFAHGRDGTAVGVVIERKVRGSKRWGKRSPFENKL